MNELNDSLPNIIPDIFDTPDFTGKPLSETPGHAPRILMLYGSVRERSYSRLTTEEGARLLTAMGAEVRIFNPSGLPCQMMLRIPTQKLPSYVNWCDGQKEWCGAP
jgi:arsenic resistance protein ArsH